MAVATKILEQIKELDGKCLGERYQIMNRITHDVQNSDYNSAESAEILKSFKPKDNIEKKLWVDLVSVLKHEEIYKETLKGEDDELIEIMFQNGEWFFTRTNFNIDDLMQEVIPNISYSKRHQLLRGLSEYRSEEEIEEYFVALRQQYGLHSALLLLPSCGTKFIEHVLKEEKMRVTEKLLQKIYAKNSEAAINYLTYLLDNANLRHQINTHKTILKNIALTKPGIFLKLYRDPDVINVGTLGANTTKNIIKVGKSLILESPKSFMKILHRRQLHASLNYGEYKQFYLGLCPETEKEFANEFNRQGNVHTYLLYVKKDKLQFLLNAYKTCYGKELVDNEQIITETLMDMLSPELRIKCALFMIENKERFPANWEKWYCYIKPEEAIPKFRELIYMTTDPSERIKYVEYMVKCTGINKDIDALIKVMKYISERHRNEDIRFREKVLNMIVKYFNGKQLNVDMWNFIDELFGLINLGNEWGVISQRLAVTHLLTERIRYSLDNSLNIKEHIEYLLKFEKPQYFSLMNILQDNPDYESKCIFCIGDCLPHTFSHAFCLQRTISDFNKRNSGQKITVLKFQWAIFSMTAHVIKEKCLSDIENIRVELEYDPEAKEYFDPIMPPVKIEIKVHNLRCYIKQSELIFKHFDEIKNDALQTYNAQEFLRIVKWRKFIYIPKLREKILEVFLTEFNNSKEYVARAIALKIIACLIDFEAFYEIIKPFYPEDKKLTVAKTDIAHYNIQRAVASCILKYPGPDVTFEALDKFCCGDFLKLTLGSLSSVCQKTNEVKSLNFLHKMLDKPVSTKKHAIRLLNLISKKSKALEMLKNLWTTEKNPSIRNVLITAMFNWFKIEYDSDTWDLLKGVFLELTKLDKDILGALLNFDDMNKEYTSEHIKLCWLSIQHLELNEKLSLNQEKSTVLNRITRNINILEPEFLDSLVPLSFQTTNARSVQNSFNEFVATYVIIGDHQNQSNKRILAVKDAMQQYIRANWNESNPKNCFIFPARHIVFEFYEMLCNISVQNRKQENTRLNLLVFFNKILEIFNPTQFYEKYLLLQLTLDYLDSQDIHDFCKKLKEEFIYLNINEFGPEILSHLIDAIKEIIQLIRPEDEEGLLMELAKALIEDNRSQHCEICALKLLVKSEATKKAYNEILSIIKESPNKAVQIYLNELVNE